MTSSPTISPYFKIYTNFRIGRIITWQPKLLAAVKETADSFIAGATMPAFGKLATTIQAMYTDAGRVMGAYAYQNVRKQKKGLQSESKALLPIGYNEQLINLITQYYQTNLFNEAVLPISQTIRDYVLARLIEAQQRGYSIDDVAKAIEPYLYNRSLLIARTETVKAANYGAKQGAILTGYQMNKVWISAQDYRTRRTPRDSADHLHMNNVEVGMDELFKAKSKTDGFDLMDRPGDSNAPANQVVQCRCALGFRVL